MAPTGRSRRYADGAGPVSGDISSSGDDIPAGEATGLSPPSATGTPTRGGTTTCSDSRHQLDERYADASPDDLAARIEAAKAALGDRVFILGHHYQRDEVIRWADARGDSYRLSVLAQEQHEAEFIVFCGVHFMAESADVLTADHQQVILPDLNAGCSMADMADLDEVEEAWEALAAVTDIERVDPDHLHELLGRPEGVRGPQRRRRVHLHQRPRRARLGARQGRPRRPATSVGATGSGDKVLFFPDQHLGPQHRAGHGLRPRRHAGVEPAPRAGRAHRGGLQGRHPPALEGPLLGPPAVPPRARRGVPGRAPRRHRRRPTPSAATTPASWPTTSAPPTSSSAP